MLEAATEILSAEPRIEYALVFGSVGRGTAHVHSDVDVAIGVSKPLTRHELGDLASRLEAALERRVDIVLMHEAPPPIAYRVFRDGQVLFERNRDAFVKRKARAVLEYLDFKPIEDILTKGALRAAARGR